MTLENKLVEIVKAHEESISDAAKNPFKDKWVSILGDSISTYNGWVPAGNSYYYPKDDVNDVKKTWWHILLKKLGAKLCVNESWNGRKVCDLKSVANSTYNAVGKLHRETGKTYKNLDGKDEVATEDIKPDIILVFLGINDYNGNVDLGDITAFKHNINIETATDFMQAYNTFICHVIATHYPKCQCYVMEPAYVQTFGFQEDNATGASLGEYQAGVRKVSEIVGTHCIHISRICVHAQNWNDNLVNEDKIHPREIMMRKIANQCYSEMLASNCLE